MNEYLNDTEFLKLFDQTKLRKTYVEIELLDFNSELPISSIQGTVNSGTLTIDANSNVRRTISLSMITNQNSSNIENLDNIISIKRKIKIKIGYKNYLSDYIKKYGEIIWFPCGVYVISNAQVSRSTSGWSISISAKDKMVLLNGYIGGTFPASTTLHERYEYNYEEGNKITKISYPTIVQIISELVNHYGNEDVNKIFINDLDTVTKLQIKYVGKEPIYFNSTHSHFSFVEDAEHKIKYEINDDVGYQPTDFTYPGELIMAAGETVTNALDKIIDILGNYEYFYDLDGNFVFQEKKNYLNNQGDITKLSLENYTKEHSNGKYEYAITDLNTVTSIQLNPNYENLKNDFIVWGTRQSKTSNTKFPILYHLAIDKKPELDKAKKYMWKIYDNNNFIVRYDYNLIEQDYKVSGYNTELVGKPCEVWQEELYRNALEGQVNSDYSAGYYDAELLAYWRSIFDTMNKNWYNKNKDGFNPDVYDNPKNINYWLDFIDEGTEISKYSVQSIGRRTCVKESSDINSVYNNNVEDIIFIPSDYETSEDLIQGEKMTLQELIQEYNSYGQKWFKLTPQYDNLFSPSGTKASAYDYIREMMYQHLTYNTSITISCLPKYYLDVNQIIYIEDKNSNIQGNYEISRISLPLSYNGTMSIQATEQLNKI